MGQPDAIRGHSLFENRSMVDFQIRNGLCSGSGTGSGYGIWNFFTKIPAPPPLRTDPPPSPTRLAADNERVTHMHTYVHMSSRLTLIHPDYHLLGKKLKKWSVLFLFCFCFVIILFFPKRYLSGCIKVNRDDTCAGM